MGIRGGDFLGKQPTFHELNQQRKAPFLAPVFLLIGQILFLIVFRDAHMFHLRAVCQKERLD